MLFDLQGKRRRVVQATYLTLAVLMGGGLVLFGIGGDVQGGLFDAFSGGGGGGNDVVEERVDSNEERVKANPAAEAPRKELVRDYYQLAVGQVPDGAVTFPEDARDELRQASSHWSAYLDAKPKSPDPSLARVALQVFDPAALDQPQQALHAARIVAKDGGDVNSYMLLVQYSALASDKRTLKLAERKALALAPNSQRKAVKQQIEQLKGAAIAAQLQEAGVEPTVAGGKAGEKQSGKAGGKQAGGSGAGGQGGDSGSGK